MDKVFVIAEAGVNHNGDISLAIKLIEAAFKAGAGAVKFQTFIADKIVTESGPKAKYQKRNSFGGTQLGMLHKLQLSEADFKKLRQHCKKRGIMFLSTPFDLQSAKFLNRLGVVYFKISSGDLTNLPFLKKVAQFNRPIILSTGMSNLQEVKEAVNAIRSENKKELVLLHCTSNYPADYNEVNLMAIATLKKEFNLPVGYSDHTRGIEVAIAAVAMGAKFIEKHLTLDRKMSGPDHAASLEPDEFMAMVEAIRNIEKAKGTGLKAPAKSEMIMQKIARKSLVSACKIKKGTLLNARHLVIKRPGNGIEPKYLDQIIGKKINRDIKNDQVLSWEMIK